MAFEIIKEGIPEKKELLIEAVSEGYNPVATEKVFYQDFQSKVVYQKKPFLSTGRDWRRYKFDTSKIYEYKGMEKSLEALDNSLIVTLQINCKFQLRNNLSVVLFRKFIDSHEHHLDVLQGLLFSWIDEFANSHTDFIKNFFKNKSDLIDFIENRALDHGIKLETLISLKRSNPDDYHVIEGKLPIRVNDYPGKIMLGYRIDLEIIEEKKMAGIMSFSAPNFVQNAINKIIRKTLSNDPAVTLHVLYNELNSVVRELVEKGLKKELDQDGLEPIFVELIVDKGEFPPQRKEVQYTVDCVTKNKHIVSIDHTLILTLKDLGCYYSKGIKDLEQWVKDELKRLTQDFIFERDFTDLAVNFDDQIIKDGMRKEADKIGYVVKQLITIPDLQKIIPEYVEFEVGKTHDFATKRDDLKVKLNVLVTGRVTDLSKMTWMLNPNTNKENVIQKIKDRLLNTVRRFIHTIEPEDFYMRFDYNDQESQLTVSDELQGIIKERLKSDFGISDAEVICKPLETELVKKFLSIQWVSYPLRIESKSGEIKFDIPFDVLAVDPNGWHIFKAKCDALKGRDPSELLKEIARRLKYFVEFQMEEWKHGFVSVMEEEFKNRFDQYLIEGCKVIQAEFGLSIAISKGWVRHRTSIEELMIEGQKDALENKKSISKLLNKNNLEEVKELLSQEEADRQDYLDDPEKVRKRVEELKKDHLTPSNMEVSLLKLEQGLEEPKAILEKNKKNENKKLT